MSLSRRLGLAAVALAGISLISYSVAVRAPEPERAPLQPSSEVDPTTGSVLIDLDDDADEDDLRRVAELLDDAIEPFDWRGGVGEELSDEAQLYRVTPPPSEIDDIRRALASDADVEAVEVERIWTLPEGAQASALQADDESGSEAARGPFRPNDPYYQYQWHLDQIQMPEAWQRSQGADVVVAVIDTGVSYRDASRFRMAPDLKQTRIVAGRDLVDNDDTPDDEHGHGTHVAGTVAQSTNNGVGVAGVAPRAAIMPVRVLDARGAGRWGSVAAGIRWAADHGAHVINLSLGGAMKSSAISNAIAHAHRKGVVVVAAAGNTGRGRVQYPGADRYAIGVGAVRFDETLSFYSSFGRHLDVVAPGGDLRVDQNGDGKPDGVLQNTIVRGNPAQHDYIAYQGTSMAAPHVAGVAALIRSAGVTDPDAVERILKETAKSKRDKNRYGAGLIQANDALRAASKDLNGARGGLAALLAGLLLLGFRRRKSVEGAGLAIGTAMVAAGGLALLPWHWVGASAATGSTLAFLGSVSWLNPIALSAVPIVALVGIAYGVPKIRPVLAGVSFGFAAMLVVEAVVPTLSFGWMAASLVGPWLLANAIIVALVGRQVARQQ